jgi:hypothetical protein
VIDGIQKRIEVWSTPMNSGAVRRRCYRRRSGCEAAAAIESQIRATSVKIDRVVEALAAGTGDVPSLQNAVVTLEREQAQVVGELHAARSRRMSEERQAIIARAPRAYRTHTRRLGQR